MEYVVLCISKDLNLTLGEVWVHILILLVSDSAPGRDILGGGVSLLS